MSTTRQGRRVLWSAGRAPTARMRRRSFRSVRARSGGCARLLVTVSRTVRRKMTEAVDLSKLHGTEQVNRALQTCANAGRFADGDLARILAHQQQAGAGGELVLFPGRSEDSSLQASTKAWEGFGA